jgi:Tfp pilus assembly protein PilF
MEKKTKILAGVTQPNGFVKRARAEIALWWKHMTLWRLLKLFSGVAAAIPGISLLFVLFWQIGTEMFDQSLAIQPISTPDALIKHGYSPNVAAQRIADAIDVWIRAAKTNMKAEHAFASIDAGRVITPDSHNSAAGLISSLMHFLHLSNRVFVAGEITELIDSKGSDPRYVLTVRTSGDVAPLTPTLSMDELFRMGARHILASTQPYIIASADFESDLKRHNDWNGKTTSACSSDFQRSFFDANTIISTRAWGQPDVILAYNLRGVIHKYCAELPAAISDYRAAIAQDQTIAIFHANYGAALLATGDPKVIPEARRQVEYAVDHGIDDSFTHTVLGDVFLAERNPQQAEHEYRYAIQRDNSYSDAHSALADALRTRRAWTEAITEYRTTIQFTPNDSDARSGLAQSLLMRQHGSPSQARADWNAACEQFNVFRQLRPRDKRFNVQLSNCSRSRTFR